MAAREFDTGRPNRLRGVAFIVPGFDAPGGMEGQARRLAVALAAQGVPITYVTSAPSGWALPRTEVLGLVQVLRVPVLSLVDWTTSLDLLELAALAALASRRDRVDAIYSVHHTIGSAAARVGRALGAPVVVKLAGGGAFGDARTVLASPRRERLLVELRGVSRLVAMSDALAHEARDLLGVAPERVVRIPNGVDLELFKPDARVARTPGRLLYLGRLAHEKRLDVLLDAFARIARARPDASLHLAGDGPERAALEARVARQGLGGRVRFLGMIDDPVQALRDATALVLTSTCEGMSNAVLEALATGVPVVATRIDGMTDVVRDGVEGLLVEPGDVAELAAALERVLGDPALAATLAAGARRRVEAEFDLEAVAGRYALLFEELKLARRPDEPGLHAPTFARATLRAVGRMGRDAAVSSANIVRGRLARLAGTG
jgi:glycosyltransferase involved in cell wall biosynthesis